MHKFIGVFFLGSASDFTPLSFISVSLFCEAKLSQKKTVVKFISLPFPNSSMTLYIPLNKVSQESSLTGVYME